MTIRSSIKFLRHGEIVELTNVGPNETVLDYLRLREGAKGTKEGCCEGDCGACTVAVGSPIDGQIQYQAVNSCIQLLGTLDGKELITVDDLANDDGSLHPVQQAMVDHHGSQCGFCTPGFVMSLFVLQQDEQAEKNRQTINETLAGNLCRCTGYRAIVDAACQICLQAPREQSPVAFGLLNAIETQDIFIATQNGFFASPTDLHALAKLYDQHKDAVLVAGTTDVGLWITKQQKDLPKIIYLGRVRQLQVFEHKQSALIIGAGVTYATAQSRLAAIDPELEVVLKRIGSKQVRNAGTIGGNIANGSPIGDMPPMLIALGASIELVRVDASRTLPLEAFFLEYGKQDIAPGEFLAKITIPHLNKNQVLRCYKISKRFDQDISAIMAAFCFTIDDGIVSSARLVFGGMAGTPARATQTENAIKNLPVDDQQGWQEAAETLAKDFTPLSDMRASAGYRLQTAKALVTKARAEISGEAETRILKEYANA